MARAWAGDNPFKDKDLRQPVPGLLPCGPPSPVQLRGLAINAAMCRTCVTFRSDVMSAVTIPSQKNKATKQVVTHAEFFSLTTALRRWVSAGNPVAWVAASKHLEEQLGRPISSSTIRRCFRALGMEPPKPPRSGAKRVAWNKGLKTGGQYLARKDAAVLARALTELYVRASGQAPHPLVDLYRKLESHQAD